METFIGKRKSATQYKDGIRKTSGYVEIEKFVYDDKSAYCYIVPKSNTAVWLALVPGHDCSFLARPQTIDEELMKRETPLFYEHWQYGIYENYHNYALKFITDPDYESQCCCFVSVLGNLDEHSFSESNMEQLNNRISDMFEAYMEMHMEIELFIAKIEHSERAQKLEKTMNKIAAFVEGGLKLWSSFQGNPSGDFVDVFSDISDSIINRNLSDMTLPDVFTDAGFH